MYYKNHKLSQVKQGKYYKFWTMGKERQESLKTFILRRQNI